MDGGNAGTIIGFILAIIVGIVCIIGGIKRIASVTEKIVPFYGFNICSSMSFYNFFKFQLH